MGEARRQLRDRARAGLAIAVLGLCLAGCAANGTPTLAMLGAAPRGTVAFESIDGLPEGHFRQLVQSLTREADARQLAVVARNQPAQYRVRGYAAASIRGKRTTIAWVWDVYDAEQQRAVRIVGEEQATGRRGWAAADDSMLQRMAREGMTQLASFLGSPEGAPPPATIPPSDGGAAVAAVSPPAEEGPASSLVPTRTLRTSGLASHAALTDAPRR